MLEEPFSEAQVITEVLVSLIDQDKQSYPRGGGIRLPEEVRRTALAAMHQVIHEARTVLGRTASMECLFLAVRIVDATTVEDMNGALDGEIVVAKVMVRAAAALWIACKLTLLQSTSSKLLNIIVEIMTQYVAMMAPQSRLRNLPDMKEAVLAQERRLLSHCSDVISLPTTFTFLTVVTKRFDIATGSVLDGTRGTLQGLNAWTEHAANMLEYFRAPSSGKDSAYHRAVAVLGLGLMVTGVIPASTLAPPDVATADWQRQGLYLQTLTPPGISQADWEALRLPQGARLPGLATAALELAAELPTSEMRPTVQMVMEVLLLQGR